MSKPKRKPGDPPLAKELKMYGFHAAQSVWQHRPQDIIRVYVTQERLKKFGDLLKWCAAKKKAYHVVDDEALAKVAASVHHEGVCILVKDKARLPFSEWIGAIEKDKSQDLVLLYLDGVQNPHNIGSILRVCAHFGCAYILGQHKFLPALSPSAYRVAEGGAELVEIVEIEHPINAFKRLTDAGFAIVATSSHAKKSLFTHKFKGRSVILLGAEVEGLNSKFIAEASDTVAIPGTGKIESLNVAMAGAVFIAEYRRQIDTAKAAK